MRIELQSIMSDHREKVTVAVDIRTDVTLQSMDDEVLGFSARERYEAIQPLAIVVSTRNRQRRAKRFWNKEIVGNPATVYVVRIDQIVPVQQLSGFRVLICQRRVKFLEPFEAGLRPTRAV